MKTIRSRPRSSSSVPRNTRPVQDNLVSRNIQESTNFDENESDNSFQKPKIKPSRNSQWRKLRPPNFQSYIKNESRLPDSSKSFDKDINSTASKSKIDNDTSISKISSSSSKRRSQSLTREKNNYKKDLKTNDEYDYDFYFNHQLNQSKQNDYRQSERRKNSINFDEFKNPDGSPRKISQKFRHLKQRQPKDNNDFTQFTSKPNQPFKKEDMLTPRKEDPAIRKRRSDSVSNSITIDSNIPSTPKDKLASTPNLSSKYKKKPNITEISFREPESEQVATSIEIALNRIQKELKEKDNNNNQSSLNKEAKPVIKKKKKSFFEQQQRQQNQTTINLPNYEQIDNEQKNKSVIEETKPHVQFIDTVKPPRKKEFVPPIIENNIEREPKSFVEPTKSDFNKKIEFPPDYMKNMYSSFMNSSGNQI